jgi:hypothetical protein
MDTPTIFILINFSFAVLLNMAIVLSSDVLRQTLKHSVQNYVILCNVMSSRLFKLLLNNVWKL